MITIITTIVVLVFSTISVPNDFVLYMLHDFFNYFQNFWDFFYKQNYRFFDFRAIYAENYSFKNIFGYNFNMGALRDNIPFTHYEFNDFEKEINDEYKHEYKPDSKSKNTDDIVDEYTKYSLKITDKWCKPNTEKEYVNYWQNFKKILKTRKKNLDEAMNHYRQKYRDDLTNAFKEQEKTKNNTGSNYKEDFNSLDKKNTRWTKPRIKKKKKPYQKLEIVNEINNSTDFYDSIKSKKIFNKDGLNEFNNSTDFYNSNKVDEIFSTSIYVSKVDKTFHKPVYNHNKVDEIFSTSIYTSKVNKTFDKPVYNSNKVDEIFNKSAYKSNSFDDIFDKSVFEKKVDKTFDKDEFNRVYKSTFKDQHDDLFRSGSKKLDKLLNENKCSKENSMIFKPIFGTKKIFKKSLFKNQIDKIDELFDENDSDNLNK